MRRRYPHLTFDQALAHPNGPQCFRCPLLIDDRALADHRRRDWYHHSLICYRWTVLNSPTGGEIKFNTANKKVHYGTWNPNAVGGRTTPFSQTSE